MRLFLTAIVGASFVFPISNVEANPQTPNCGGPSWSVKVFAFDASGHIFVLSPANQKPKRISEGESPVIAPDGSKVAFCVRQGLTSFSSIQLVNSDGTGRRELMSFKGGACPTDWSPDGERIAFNALGGQRAMVGLVSKDGKDVRLVAQGYGARWSPDGKRLVICREAEKRGMTDSLWIVDVDGTNATKVVDDNSQVLEATWLPDGTGIAFASSRENRRSAIFSIKVDGTNLRKIAANERLAFYFPVFSPDGTQLVVDAAQGSNLSIVSLDLVTLQGQMLAHGGHPSIVWQKN